MVGYCQWSTLGSKGGELSRTMTAQKTRFKLWGKSIQNALKEKKETIIIGDINIDVTPWINQSNKLTEYQQSKASLLTMLKHIIDSSSMTLFKTGPTRYQGKDEPSILDLLISTHPELLTQPKLIETSSDHKMVMFQKSISIRKTFMPLRRARSYAKYTKGRMLNLLNIPHLNMLLSSKDPNHVADSLVEEINRVLNIVAPIETIQIRKHYVPYLSSITKQLMESRDKKKAKPKYLSVRMRKMSIEN